MMEESMCPTTRRNCGQMTERKKDSLCWRLISFYMFHKHWRICKKDDPEEASLVGSVSQVVEIADV